MSFPIDPKTGMPALPDNQYWEIVPADYGGVYLKLMETQEGWKKKIFGDRRLGSEYVSTVTKENLKWRAEQHLTEKAERHKHYARVDAVIGKYPPNNINEAYGE